MANVKFVTSNGSGEEARKLETEFDFGSTAEEAISMFGAEVVYDNFVAAAKVDVQGMIRRKMNGKVTTEVDGVKTERDYTDEEILAEVAGWKPTKKGVRQSADPLSKAEKLLGSMSADQLDELRAKLASMGAI